MHFWEKANRIIVLVSWMLLSTLIPSNSSAASPLLSGLILRQKKCQVKITSAEFKAGQNIFLVSDDLASNVTPYQATVLNILSKSPEEWVIQLSPFKQKTCPRVVGFKFALASHPNEPTPVFEHLEKNAIVSIKDSRIQGMFGWGGYNMVTMYAGLTGGLQLSTSINQAPHFSLLGMLGASAVRGKSHLANDGNITSDSLQWLSYGMGLKYQTHTNALFKKSLQISPALIYTQEAWGKAVRRNSTTEEKVKSTLKMQMLSVGIDFLIPFDSVFMGLGADLSAGSLFLPLIPSEEKTSPNRNFFGFGAKFLFSYGF